MERFLLRALQSYWILLAAVLVSFLALAAYAAVRQLLT